MKCDLCDNPAVVHEVTVKNGVKSEIHLCEGCARQTGVAMPQHQPIEQVLTQVVVASQKGGESKSGPAKCDACGLRYDEFRQSGVLGCQKCYDAFGRQLESLIERAQNGGTTHSDKCPLRRGASIDRQLQIQRLVKDLESAVSAEQFERAAELRDRLQEIESRLESSDSPPAGEGSSS